jgi:hypothetical protein
LIHGKEADVIIPFTHNDYLCTYVIQKGHHIDGIYHAFRKRMHLYQGISSFSFFCLFDEKLRISTHS